MSRTGSFNLGIEIKIILIQLTLAMLLRLIVYNILLNVQLLQQYPNNIPRERFNFMILVSLRLKYASVNYSNINEFIPYSSH